MKPAPRPSRPAVDLNALRSRTTVPRAPAADPSIPNNAGNAGITGNAGNAGSTSNASITGNASGDLCKITVRVPEGLAARARTAWRTEAASAGTFPSFSAWVAQALLEAVEHSEHAHNDAHPYPGTPVGVIPTGRPVGITPTGAPRSKENLP